jgi:hypothetical protein
MSLERLKALQTTSSARKLQENQAVEEARAKALKFENEYLECRSICCGAISGLPGYFNRNHGLQVTLERPHGPSFGKFTTLRFGHKDDSYLKYVTCWNSISYCDMADKYFEKYKISSFFEHRIFGYGILVFIPLAYVNHRFSLC